MWKHTCFVCLFHREARMTYKHLTSTRTHTHSLTHMTQWYAFYRSIDTNVNVAVEQNDKNEFRQRKRMKKCQSCLLTICRICLQS